jgi:hypothetical protein
LLHKPEEGLVGGEREGTFTKKTRQMQINSGKKKWRKIAGKKTKNGKGFAKKSLLKNVLMICRRFSKSVKYLKIW